MADLNLAVHHEDELDDEDPHDELDGDLLSEHDTEYWFIP